MGGGAFANPKDPSKSLLTPRMPPAVYRHARDHALNIIRTFYASAECPIEAPAKADYGDIDVLVTGPLQPAKNTAGTVSATTLENTEECADQSQVNDDSASARGDHAAALHQSRSDIASLAVALSAPQYKTTPNSSTTNFAIPWPKNVPGSDTRNDTTSLFIQLDLHICPTPERFQWELFHQAHGDLWNIIGGMIRPFGLVVNDDGLYLRLEGVENVVKRLAKVKLTSSPAEVLRFLGLREDGYWNAFGSLDEMFAYAPRCRYHDPKRYGDKDELKSNDRIRAKKRPIFARWVEEYLPAHRGDAPGASAGATRAEVAEDATQVFGVVEEYQRNRAEALRIMGVEKLWSGVRRNLPEEVVDLRIGMVMRGLKREVIGDAEGKDVAEMTEVQRAYVEGRFEVVAEWVHKDWGSVEKRQSAYEKEKSSMHLKAKIERDKAKEVAERDAKAKELEAKATMSSFEVGEIREALQVE